MVLAVIGGAIKSSSIISSVSSSPVNDEEDFVGDYEYGFLSVQIYSEKVRQVMIKSIFIQDEYAITYRLI